MRRRRARWPRGDSRRTLAAQPRPAPPRPAAAPQLSHHVDAGWSDRLDQLLRSNVEADRNGVNKNKIRWESVAKMIPAMSADQCQARWTVLHTLPGLENKGISLLPNPDSHNLVLYLTLYLAHEGANPDSARGQPPRRK